MSESNKNQTLVVLLQPITMGDDTSKETISENDGRHNSTVDVMLQTLISPVMITYSGVSKYHAIHLYTYTFLIFSFEDYSVF